MHSQHGKILHAAGLYGLDARQTVASGISQEPAPLAKDALML